MNNRKFFTKLTTIICIVALLVSNINFTTVSSANNSAETVADITEFHTLGVEAFTGKETVTYKEDVKPSAGDQSLDGVMVDGIYQFSGSAVLYIGAANWGGLRFSGNGTDTMNYQFVDVSGKGYLHYKEITEADTGCLLFESDVRIKMGVTFVKEYTDATIVDAKITLNIGDYEDIFVLEGVKKAHLIGRMFVYANGGFVTMKIAKEHKLLSFADFGITEDLTVSNGRITKSAGAGTLDGTVIDGIYHFVKYPSLQFGQRDGMRLQIHINGRNELVYQFLDSNQASHGGQTLNASSLGCSYLNTDIRIKVGFLFSNVDSEVGTADLTISIAIGPKWEDTIQVTGVQNIENLIRSITLYATTTADSAVTLKLQQPKLLEVTPADMGIEDGIYGYVDTEESEESTEKDYTVLGVEDFAGGEIYTLAKGSAKTLTASNETLDGVMIDGIYQLSMNPVIDFGGTAWAGLQFQRTRTGAKFQFLNAVGKDVLGYVEFTAEETGGIYDEDVRIQVAFDFVSEITTDNTVDVDILICVGASTKTLSLSGAKVAYMKRAMYWSASDADITMKTTSVKNASVEGFLQNMNSSATGKMTLNGKIFSANVQFEGTDAELRIGGTEEYIWGGLRFWRKNDSYFVIRNTFGMTETLISAKEAGLDSTNEKFNLKISFEFVSLDSDSINNDVKYGIYINDTLYEQAYLYSKNDAYQYGACALIYCPNPYGKVAIETKWQRKMEENAPYILEDFGLKDGVYTESVDKTLNVVEMFSSVTGNIALNGNAKLDLYGLCFELKEGILVVGCNDSAAQTLQIKCKEIKEGETFEFCIEKEVLDLDMDGLEDDVRFGIRINGKLYKEKKYYLLDFASKTGMNAGITAGGDGTSKNALRVEPSVQVESYDLNDTENGYLVSGKGFITVNNEAVANGTVLTQPGDYLVRCAYSGAYVKLVSLYQSGDVHPDGIMSISDWMAVKKIDKGIQLETKAGLKSADIDKNHVINQVDYDVIQDVLLGVKVLEESEHDYKVYGIEDFTGKYEYSIASTQTTLSPSSVGTLDGIMIDGIYLFTGNASINFGGTAWQGLQISRVGEDKLRYQVVGAGNAVDVSSADTGCALFNTDVRIKVGFTYLAVDETAGTVDVKIKICIGDTYEDEIEAYGVKQTYLKKALFLYAKDSTSFTGSTLTLKAVEMISDKVDYLTYEDDVMPIGGFFAPYRDKTYDYVTDEIFSLIQESGINLILAGNVDYRDNPKMAEESLELADRNGLGMMMFDSRYHETLSATELAEFQKDFAQYASYKGVFVIDEPFTEASGRTDGEMMVDYVDKGAMLNNYSNTTGYINSGPMVDTSRVLYRDHMYAILESDQKMLSWDFYTFDAVTNTQWYGAPTRYFRNLSVMREMSHDMKKPFWGYIQAGSFWENSVTEENMTPSEAELLWNVNTSLAYGVKGIQYFTLLQPQSFAGAYEKNSLIDINGKPTKWFGYAKTANKQIAAVDEYLLYSNSLDILAVGSTAQSQTGITKTSYGDIVTNISADGGALVGVFDYQGKTALYVVNYDAYDEETAYDVLDQGDAAPDEITLTFGEEQKFSVISTQLATDFSEGTGVSCTLSLDNGGAALILFE